MSCKDWASSGLAPDVGAAGKDSAFLHAKHLGFDVAVEFRVGFEFAAFGGDSSLDFAKEFHFTCLDITFDVGVFTDGDLAFIGSDLTLYFTINDHVIDELDGAGDFDSIRENVGCIRHKARTLPECRIMAIKQFKKIS
jgi:hypothetical protein